MPSEKAAQVTQDWVLEQFVSIVESDAKWETKVKALELMGKFLGMFVDQKKVNIDVRQLIAGASIDDLRRLAGENVGDDLEGGQTSGIRRSRYLGMHRSNNGGQQLEQSGDSIPEDD